MDYGDGSNEPIHGATNPNEIHSFTHTYANPGTYILIIFVFIFMIAVIRPMQMIQRFLSNQAHRPIHLIPTR